MLQRRYLALARLRLNVNLLLSRRFWPLLLVLDLDVEVELLLKSARFSLRHERWISICGHTIFLSICQVTSLTGYVHAS